LDQYFKDTAAALSEADLRDRVAKTALDLAALQEAKEKDFDLKEKKEIAKEAGAVYREGIKASKLRTSYLRMMLEAKGKEAGSFETA
jgi:hypothetical protein